MAVVLKKYKTRSGRDANFSFDFSPAKPSKTSANKSAYTHLESIKSTRSTQTTENKAGTSITKRKTRQTTTITKKNRTNLENGQVVTNVLRARVNNAKEMTNLPRRTRQSMRNNKDLSILRSGKVLAKPSLVIASKTNQNRAMSSPNNSETSKQSQNERKSPKNQSSTTTKRSKVEKRRKSPPKRVHFENGHKSLRPRRRSHKYADCVTSFNSDEESSKEEREAKLPIYKQRMKVVKKKRILKSDVYAFDSIDSKSNSDSENDYDVDMMNEFKRIRCNERKKVLKRRKPQRQTRKHKKEKLPVTQKREKIKILSNVQIFPKEKTMSLIDDDDHHHDDDNEIMSSHEESCQVETRNISYNEFQSPAAHSTMMMMTMMMTSSPWRPNLRYRNGPHVLHTKRESSLPAFNQEMVLNSTIVELHEASFASWRSKKVDNTRNVRTMKQMSIRKFISGAEVPDDNAPLNRTLFDENLLLSPIKQADCVVAKKVEATKRTILRDKSNLMEVSSIANTPEWECSDVDFFKTSLHDAAATGKPTRFNLRRNEEHDAKETMIIEEKFVDSSVFESPSSQSPYDGSKLVGIYDEFEPMHISRPEPSFTYMTRKRRIQKRNSSDEEFSPTEPSKPAKRMKEAMTRKEKHEYDKWIKSFNAMCDDVDKYELCVE